MRKIAWATLLLFSFAIPWEYSLDLGAPLGNIARIAGLALLLAVVPAILQDGRMRKPGIVQLLTVALFLWFCCTCFWSIDASESLQRIRAYAQVMMTVWLAWELAEGPEDLRNLMRAYVAGCWILAVLTIANFASPDAVDQVRFAAEGQDPNDVARFLDVGFPLAALLANAETRWTGKILALGYFPLGFAAVLLTASRGGFIAAAVSFAGCGVLLMRRHRRAALGGILALPAAALLFWVSVPRAIFVRIATIPQQFMSGDLNQRLNIWQAGWLAFVHAPILGSGAGTFVDASRLAQIDTAHNTALAITVEGGLVALALAGVLVAAAARCVMRTEKSLRIGLGTALMVWVVTSLVATVEASRSTWFLLALISVAGRCAIRDPDGLIEQFEPGTRPVSRLANLETAA